MKRHGVLIVIAVGLLAASCKVPFPANDPTGSDQAGSLIIRITQDTARTLGGVSRAISTDVAKVEVKLTNAAYPALLASADYSPAGTQVAIDYIKAGTWSIDVYLNDASGNTLYHGTGSVEILPGQTANPDPIRVYATGGVAITVTEGVVAPSFEAGTPDQANQTIDVKLHLPTGLDATSARICYAVGTPPVGDPTAASTSYTLDSWIPLGFTDQLKAITVLNDGENTASAVVTFSYSMPYFDPPPASYTGFTDVVLRCESPGVTIRYTTDGSDPTYDYGTLAGRNSVVTLTQPTSVLKAVSFTAGDPASVSEVAQATYTLDVAPLLTVKQGATVYTSGSNTYDFGYLSPGDESSPVTITVGNAGNGADLLLSGDKVTLSGTNAGQFALDTSSLSASIPFGTTDTFALRFAPTVGSAYQYNGTVSILSDSSGGSPFTFFVTGYGNYAPTLNWLTGLSVQNAGDSMSNGYYSNAGTLNGYTEYSNSSRYCYYSTYFYEYVIAASTTMGMYDAGYLKNYGTQTNPVGKSRDSEPTAVEGWTYYYDYAWSPAPYVSLVDGIGGYPKVGMQLTAYYQYVDADGDGEGGTTFQWYRGSSSVGPWSAIGGATNSTYPLTASDSGYYLCVDVTPTQAAGGYAGTTQRSPAYGPVE